MKTRCVLHKSGQGRRFSFNSWSGRSAEPTIVPSQRRRQTVQESKILVPLTLMPTFMIPQFESRNRKFSVSEIFYYNRICYPGKVDTRSYLFIYFRKNLQNGSKNVQFKKKFYEVLAFTLSSGFIKRVFQIHC